MEGHFESHPDGAPLILFGLPDMNAGKVKYALEIPHFGLADLGTFAGRADEGPRHGAARKTGRRCRMTFWAFRIMVGLGFLIFALGLFSLLARSLGHPLPIPSVDLFAIAMGPAGFIAVLAGWFTTETGRQPFTVYGLLRTVESASPPCGPRGRLLACGLRHRLFRGLYHRRNLYLRLMAHPPHPGEQGPSSDVPSRAAASRRPWKGCCHDAAADIATLWAFIIASRCSSMS